METNSAGEKVTKRNEWRNILQKLCVHTLFCMLSKMIHKYTTTMVIVLCIPLGLHSILTLIPKKDSSLVERTHRALFVGEIQTNLLWLLLVSLEGFSLYFLHEHRPTLVLVSIFIIRQKQLYWWEDCITTLSLHCLLPS